MAYNEAAIRKLVDCSPAEQLYGELKPNLSQGEELEILPAYAEIGLGEYVDYVDFNDPQLIQRMYDEGITNQWITEHAFVFSNELIVDGDWVRRGRYSPGNKILTIYPRGIMRQESRRLAKALEGLEYHSQSPLAEDTHNHYSRKATRVAYHEIRHMRQEMFDGSATKCVEQKVERLKLHSCLGAAAGALIGLVGTIVATRPESNGPVEDTIGMSVVAGTTIIGAATGVFAMFRKRFKDYDNNDLENDARSVEALGEDTPTVILWPKEEYAVAQSKDSNEYDNVA